MATYLAGSVPFGFIIGKINGIDIRKHGSGNIGATNINRVLGKKWGVVCFVLDFIKGLLPVLAVRIMISEKIFSGASDAALVVAAFGTVAGHVWTIFLGFKGGKGIATSAGALLAIAPFSVLASGILWFLVFQTSRYVSLASVVSALSLPLFAYVLSRMKLGDSSHWTMALLGGLALITIIRHRSNIKRLCLGTELKFDKKSSSDAKESANA